MSSFRWTRWVNGGVLAMLLLLAYTTAWRPARAYLTEHGAHTLFTTLNTERSRAFDCRHTAGSLSIQIRSANPDLGSVSYRAPVGVLFLIPALLLAIGFPYRIYWFYLLVFHVIMGLLMTAFIAVGIAWSDMGFLLYRFFHSYLVQGLSLAAPVLALYVNKTNSPPQSGN